MKTSSGTSKVNQVGSSRRARARRATRPTTGPRTQTQSVEEQVRRAIDRLKSHATQATLQGMARYAIPSHNALGVAMKDIKALGKELGPNHDLALALWGTGWYEARLLTSFVAEPAKLTPAQMDGWCKDFDNWALCDTLSFNLFDRTPHAWTRVAKWSRSPAEFTKRTAFALLWSLALHDQEGRDSAYVGGLALIERAASDERNFVKKAVNMALRAIGRRNQALSGAAIAVATRLAASSSASARWVGKDALRELLRKPPTRQR